MSSQTALQYTPEEYLTLERQAPTKSEYHRGNMYAMSGASRWHNLIVANVVGALRPQLKGRPRVTFPSDMRVKVSATSLYTYTDVTVVCEEARFDDDQQDTRLNPTLIVEVLSRTTEAYDRGDKFAHSRQLDSLQEYVLISQETCRLEHYTRQADDRWLLAEASELSESVVLPAIDCRLALAEVYDRVDIVSRAT